MQIIINISDSIYKDLQLGIGVGVVLKLEDIVVLPVGHGRLIDYSWVVDNVIKQLGIKDERYLLEAEKALMAIVKIAPTIIEADMAESEDKE